MGDDNRWLERAGGSTEGHRGRQADSRTGSYPLNGWLCLGMREVGGSPSVRAESGRPWALWKLLPLRELVRRVMRGICESMRGKLELEKKT